jgi:hypothetical protein
LGLVRHPFAFRLTPHPYGFGPSVLARADLEGHLFPDLEQLKPRPFDVAVVHEEAATQLRGLDKPPAMLEPGNDSNMSAPIFRRKVPYSLCTWRIRVVNTEVIAKSLQHPFDTI